MEEISVSVVSLAVMVLGFVGLVIASSETGQEIKLPGGIELKLDADHATPRMRVIIGAVSILLIGFGGYLILFVVGII